MMNHRAFSTALVLSATLLLVACGDDPGAESTPKSLTLELDSSAVRVRRGDTATLQVALRPSSTVGDLTILRATQLPPGVTAGDVVLQPGASAAAELTFAASASAAQGGAHFVQIEATIGEEVLSASIELTVAGLPGEPDATFGEGGITWLEDEKFQGIWLMEFAVDDSGFYGLLDPDPAAPKRLFRLKSDGSLDPAFGTDGAVEIFARDLWKSYATLSTSPSNDRIIVSHAGHLPDTDATKVTVQCLDYKGGLVSGCDQDGSFSVPSDWTEGYIGSLHAFKAAIDGKGRLGIAQMAAAPDGENFLIHLFRYLPDGTPDPAFQGAGVVSAPIDTYRLSSLLPLDDGGYLLIGDRGTLDEPTQGYALRFTDTGAVDVDFGTDGFVALEANTTGATQAPDGTIYVAGLKERSIGVVWGLDQRGYPLEGFGVDGVLEFADRFIYSIAAGPDGSAYVPMVESRTGRTASSIMRIAVDGKLDAGFADRTTQVGLQAHSVHVGPDGNLWVGYRIPIEIGSSNVAVGRFWL